MSSIYRRIFLVIALMLPVNIALAVDSYRYTHVTIETPWMIFLFLLVIILLPFVLSAILYWHFAIKDDESAEKNE